MVHRVFGVLWVDSCGELWRQHPLSPWLMPGAAATTALLTRRDPLRKAKGYGGGLTVCFPGRQCRQHCGQQHAARHQTGVPSGAACRRIPRRIGGMRWRAHRPECSACWLITRWTWSKCACKVSADALRSLCGSGRARRAASDTTDNGNGQQQGDCSRAAKRLAARPYVSARGGGGKSESHHGDLGRVCYAAVQDGHNPHAPLYRGFIHALKTIARDEVCEPAPAEHMLGFQGWRHHQPAPSRVR